MKKNEEEWRRMKKNEKELNVKKQTSLKKRKNLKRSTITKWTIQDIQWQQPKNKHNNNNDCHEER